MRFGIAFMAPLGRSRSVRYMFSGEVNMCRIMVIGSNARKAMKDITWAIHQPWCHPARSPANWSEPPMAMASG